LELRHLEIFGLYSEKALSLACEILHKRLISHPEMEDGKRPHPSSRKSLSGSDFAGVGIQFAFSIIVFLFAGQWLDKRLGTNGLFTIAGVFVGGGAAFYNMYRKVTAAQRRDDADRQASGQESGENSKSKR
jgi:F0F1-type ATP synthase assembly protein I